MKKILLLILWLAMQNVAQAQYKKDTVQELSTVRYVLPSALIFSGIALNNGLAEQKLKENINKAVGEEYSFPIDDYAQFAPIAIMGIANLTRVEARNHWFDQAKYLMISNLLVSGITHGLKRTIQKTRPNGGNYAFPSGHTSFAFTNAMVLYKEYQNTSPFIAYSGFTTATTTGVFRMLNNKHWLSDVLAGAGIAIFVTELVYHIEPLKNFNPFIKNEKLSFFPSVSFGQQYGATLVYKL